MYNYPYFDTHCDTISLCRRGEGMFPLSENSGHIDLKRGGAYPQYAQVFAIFADAKVTPNPFAECKAQHQTFCDEVEKNSDRVMICKTLTDLKRAQATHKIAAIQSIEGGELLDCEPRNLDLAKEWGVRSVNITWNRDNSLSGTNVEQPSRGLSMLGKEFVAAAQHLNILVDVSHISDKGFWDIMRMTRKPIIASHSNARAVCDHSRNLTDEMFKELMAIGGCVGINMYAPFIGRKNKLEDIIVHIEHFLDMGGEHAVGFGCDFDGCDSLPAGIEGLQSMWKIAEAMEKRNYSSQLIEDIFYNNMRNLIFKGED